MVSKKLYYFFTLLLFVFSSQEAMFAKYQPEFSTAGFYELENTGRRVYSMNPAWRFHKGTAAGAEAVEFDDSRWRVVSLPDGIEYLPTEASGCINYQGEVWYRKHFTPAAEMRGKKLFLHFEAIMGKSKVYVNGELLAEHFGGYLPVVVDVTEALSWEYENVIAVWADNSNDPSYPPGKAQEVLDYTYFGGIYRDCWLVAHNRVFITDPNFENRVANGGLFVSFDKVSEASAEIRLQLHLRNEDKRKFTGTVEFEMLHPNGKTAGEWREKLQIGAGKDVISTAKKVLEEPNLWSPESPYLYNLLVRIYDDKGEVVDGYRRRVGIRGIEFKGEEGFWLNGKPYDAPLIGANRHQDFAIVGNAVPNTTHWRDAKKLRDAGLKIIRNAHCPQDPAFMDACDELGLFVIVNTPGWQFWSDEPEFAQRVYSDIRSLVRRDRNHPCVWLWEPILNETRYPAAFAQKALDVVNQEYPFPYSYAGCDSEAWGHEVYPVLFTHPSNAERKYAIQKMDSKICYFTREWGDNVDDWNSHNSTSRVARNWGEYPMLVQARHYAAPDYPFTSYDVLYRTSRQHVGGCLWHAFDHQRGYHPDPFYGGLMDVFRQPKYAYHLFKAQRAVECREQIFETGPMVYIAHEMTPFSPTDVTVFSNCDEVRLTYNKGGKVWNYARPVAAAGMPSPIITFGDVYDFMIDKNMSMREKKQDDVFLLAEGVVDGKVVATHEVRPARRPEKILLWLDNETVDLRADGSDFVVVVAAIADKNGNIKRLNNANVRFEVEGEGLIVGGAEIQANPSPVRWGTAPVLIRSTLRDGEIKVTASAWFEGAQVPASAVLKFSSVPTSHRQIYDAEEAAGPLDKSVEEGRFSRAKTDEELEDERRVKVDNALKLKEVEQQQADFGEVKTMP